MSPLLASELRSIGTCGVVCLGALSACSGADGVGVDSTQHPDAVHHPNANEMAESARPNGSSEGEASDVQDGDVLLEEELTEEDLAALRPPPTESRLLGPALHCSWRGGPGVQSEQQEPTRDAKIALGQEALVFVRQELPSPREVALYWRTNQQEAAPESSVDHFVDPAESVEDTLTVSIEQHGKAVVEGCGDAAYVPLRVSVRSSVAGIEGAAMGYLDYPSGAVSAYFETQDWLSLSAPSGKPAYLMALAWDGAVENWKGTVFLTEDEELSEQEPEQPDALSAGYFPVACGGVDQVPTSESGGFVAAADLQRYANALGLVPVEFPGRGTTQLSLQVTELLSETTCIHEWGGQFPARLSLIHPSGAQLETETPLGFNACPESGLLDEPIFSDSCLQFRLSGRYSLLPGDPFATALAAELDFELSEDSLEPDTLLCEVSLEITADGVEPQADSFCRLGTGTATEGSWQFGQ